jgi:hypothetical protein
MGPFKHSGIHYSKTLVNSSDPYNKAFTNDFSLTSLSLGSFYAIASYQNNIPMMIAAVPGRLLAMVVFHRSGGGWKNVAPFEGVMGVLTAVGLWWDWRGIGVVDGKEE